MFLYHHCRPLDSIIFGEVFPKPEYADTDFLAAYQWLEKEIGYFPLFLAVGNTEKDLRMTGYGLHGSKYRGKGEFPNEVLFSFESMTGIFIDFNYWHIVLNAGYRDYKITEYEKKLIFKPSWSKATWLREARKNPHSVQLVIPKLYLPSAKRIWVRNKMTERLLESMGFKNIEVKRLTFI